MWKRYLNFHRFFNLTKDLSSWVVVVSETELNGHKSYPGDCRFFSSKDAANTWIQSIKTTEKYHIFKYDSHTCIEISIKVKEDC